MGSPVDRFNARHSASTKHKPPSHLEANHKLSDKPPSHLEAIHNPPPSHHEANTPPVDLEVAATAPAAAIAADDNVDSTDCLPIQGTKAAASDLSRAIGRTAAAAAALTPSKSKQSEAAEVDRYTTSKPSEAVVDLCRAMDPMPAMSKQTEAADAGALREELAAATEEALRGEALTVCS
jgi:hypothetical protein